MASGGIIYTYQVSSSFYMRSSNVKAILRNLKVFNAGITDGRDL
jgi:hypothetical protein